MPLPLWVWAAFAIIVGLVTVSAVQVLVAYLFRYD